MCREHFLCGIDSVAVGEIAQEHWKLVLHHTESDLVGKKDKFCEYYI